MQVVAFMNMKGGVGKTTLAVNVAYALSYYHEKKVLLVDSDPQFNASQYLMSTDEYLAHVEDEKKGTIMDIFVPRRPGPISTVKGQSKPLDKKKMSLSACTCSIYESDFDDGRLDLIPSTLKLIELETAPRLTETKLRKYLEEKAEAYDYVIIDCAPTITIFTQAALLASDMYLVPIKPDPLSILGVPLLERWLEEYTDAAGITVDPVGFVFTMVRGPAPKTMKQVMADLRSARKDSVFKDYLSESTDVATSVANCAPIFLHNESGKAAIQIKAIAEEFLKRTSGA